MKQTLQLRLNQQLTMTPQLQHAIRLLQMSSFELQREVQEALESNLMLEEGDEAEQDSPVHTTDSQRPESPESRQEETSADIRQGELDAEAEREVHGESTEMPETLPVDSQWSDVYDGYLPATGHATGQHDDFDPLSIRSRPQTLHDHLFWQLNLARLTPRELTLAEAVIDSIDHDGYLRADLDELLAALAEPESTRAELERIIHLLQSFDPPGVGARDPRECLLIQLRQHPGEDRIRDLAIAVCERGFEHLPRRDTAMLARLLNTPEHEIVTALALIRTLVPKPGTLIDEQPPAYVIPDLLVRKDGTHWRVELNDEALPRLRVNTEYERLITRGSRETADATLKNHLQEARWFIRSLSSRSETVLRVGTKIVELQQAFLEHGEEAMRPLVLRDVAEALELHESTVSRVTTQKYMRTPRGTYEFKYFFSSHVGTTSGGECSSTAIRARIRRLIDGEPANKPLSDSKIAQQLATGGIKVARRTIAKYREAMGIPPSNERKRMA